MPFLRYLLVVNARAGVACSDRRQAKLKDCKKCAHAGSSCRELYDKKLAEFGSLTVALSSGVHDDKDADAPSVQCSNATLLEFVSVCPKTWV